MAKKKTGRERLADQAKEELKEERADEVREQIKEKLREVAEAERIVKRLKRQYEDLVEERDE